MKTFANNILMRKKRCEVKKHKCYSLLFIAALCIAFIAGCDNTVIQDTTPPTVSFVNPANLDTDVPINRKIAATFSEAMDPRTITTTTFTIEEGLNPVTGTVAYIGTTAIFTPVSDLAYNTVYTATITTVARDLAGNALESTYVWSFTTGNNQDYTPPTVTFTNPANLATDVMINRKIAATFSQAMDPFTITTATFTLKKGTVPVTGTVTYTDAIATDVSAQCLNLFNVWGKVAYTGTTAIFTPTRDLATNTVYTATITTGARGLAGNALENTYVWSFTTGTMADSTPPTVTFTNPANGDTDVAINWKISATFSEAMDPFTITTATFTMKQGTTPVSGTVTYTGVTATFTPSSDLAYNTAYTATITTEANDLAEYPLQSTYVWSFTTGNIPDTTRPTVTGTINANGATNVAINTKVGATFSEAMDPLTITNLTFTFEAPGGTPVLGTVSYSGVSAIFAPLSNLAPNTLYTATIKGGVSGAKDLAGNPLASDYVWSWTTGAAPDTTRPTVTGTINANGATNVAINTKVGATFSEGMDPLTINNLTFTLESPVGTPVLGTVSYSGVNAVFIPLSNLATNTSYTATITTEARDLAGNALASNYTWTFTTHGGGGGGGGGGGTPADTTAPTVTGTIHANGATNVAINTKVGATFSEGMDPLTITNLTFTLESPVGTPVLGTVSYSGVNAVFIPLSNLAPSTLYTVTIKGGVSGAKDLAGNPLASDFVISWTTSATPDTTAPTVTGTIHANGATNVAINTKVGATFSEGMDPLTITNLTFTLESPVGTPVLGTVSYSGVNAVFIPLSNLAPSTLYTVTIKGGVSGAKDLAGNPLASDFVISWTTSATPDTTAPTVTSTNPANADTNVAINKRITAVFSEGMDPLTIINLTFTLEAPVGTPVPGTVDYNLITNVATFIPGSNLAPNTTFTATITTGAEDLAGNALASDYVWTFTTGTQTAQTVPQGSVPLGSCSTFAILASAAITNIPTSAITGDVGLTPDTGANITGFSVPATCPEVTGKMYVVDAAGPACAVIDPTLLTNAKTDALAAFENARAAARGTPQAISGDLNGLTLYPGLYESGTSLEISPGGFLYLDAQGDVNAVFIIRSATSITTEATSQVVLTKGTKASNVYWTAGSAVTLGTSSIMKGTIIAGTGISMLNGANLEGRLLNQGPAAAAITLDANIITVPSP